MIASISAQMPRPPHVKSWASAMPLLPRYQRPAPNPPRNSSSSPAVSFDLSEYGSPVSGWRPNGAAGSTPGYPIGGPAYGAPPGGGAAPGGGPCGGGPCGGGP